MIWNLNQLLFEMSFINKLNDTYELLNKLDEIMVKDKNNSHIKKQLLSVSEDLEKYKDIDKKNIELDKNEIKSKIKNLLKRIDEIEINFKSKLIITEKYNSYLNS